MKHKLTNHKHKFILLLGCCYLFNLHSQTTGNIFRDFNGNGTKDANEPGIGGAIIDVYNSSNQLVASYTSSSASAALAGNYSIPLSGAVYNGTQGSNTGFIGNGVNARLEFILPASPTCGSNTALDYPAFRGSGATASQSSINFVTGGTSGINYGIQTPEDYNTGTANASVLTSILVNGNPTGGAGGATNSGTQNWFVNYPYTANGTGTSLLTRTLNGQNIGSTWGIAYSKPAQKVFVAAFIKRHSGLGALGSGGIYMLTPSGTNTYTVTSFFDMDNNTFNTAGTPVTRTRATAAAPAYGNGTSYQLNNGGTNSTQVTYLGAVDALTGKPSGLGVIGTSTQRGINVDASLPSNDPAAFDQVGKVGLGNIEISEDGKYLFVINLYQRRLFRLELDNATNPTSVIAVTDYALPTQACNNGVLRPFGIKYYKNKLYVGAVCSGENGGVNVINGATDLSAYVFEVNNPKGAAAFNNTPIVSYLLNYRKGASMSWTGPYGGQWNPWTANTSITTGSGTNRTYPQPILSDIEFDDRGDMMMSFTDRGGNQWGEDNYINLSGTNQMRYAVGGDIITAGINCGGTYTAENNGSISSMYSQSLTGSVNNQGPGTGEFLVGEALAGSHDETALGALAQLKGTGELYTSIMDPVNINSGGSRRLSTTNGTTIGSSSFELYTSGAAFGGKSAGLGDIELITPLITNEIGNRVWNDLNRDGIQTAGEPGIGNVTIELYPDFDNNGSPDVISLSGCSTNSTASAVNVNCAGATAWTNPGNATTINASSATATLASGTSSQCLQVTGLGFMVPSIATITSVTASIVRSANTAGLVVDNTVQLLVGGTATGNNLATATTYPTTLTAASYGGDPSTIWGTALTPAQVNAANFGINFRAGRTGAGSATANIDAIQVTICYTTPTGAFSIASTTSSVTAGNQLGAWYFNSSNVLDGDPTVAGNQSGPQANKRYLARIANTNWTGGVGAGPLANLFMSTANVGGSGQPDLRDNDAALVSSIPQMSILVGELGHNDHSFDFGFHPKSSIGDFVWLDTDQDGTQDVGEVGISGMVVTLYDNSGNPVSTVVTDAFGYYLFDDISAGTYTVGFSLPADYVFSTKDNAGNDNTDSDVNVATGRTDAIVVNPGDHITSTDAGIHYANPIKSYIGDYVWYDTNGNGIQDATEKGVSNITVTLYNNVGVPIASTVTDGNGAYHFTIFTAGTYHIGFSLPIGYTFTTPNATTDNIDSDASNTAGVNFGKTPTFVVVLGTDNLTLDAGIIPASNTNASIGDYVWYDLNQDGIQDSNEPGIGAVLVTLKDETGATIATTYTNELGYYIFNDVPAGTYSVTFTAPAGYTFSNPNNGEGTNDSDANPVDGQTPLFTIIAGDHRTDIDAGLFQNTCITNAALGNYVWLDADKDGIQDANESGVAGVTVSLLNSGGTVIDNTITNAEGMYLFVDLAAGTYSVVFSNLPLGYVFTSPNQIGTESTDSDALTNGQTNAVTLIAGDRYLDLDAGIHLGGSSGGNGSLGDFVWNDLNGDGIQDSGEPGIGFVLVTLYASDGVTVIATTRTDITGHYIFTNLPSGTYYIGFSQLPSGFSFVTANQGGNALTDSDADNTGMTTAISLGEGENNMSIDAGLQNTTNTGSIGDYVWSDTDGDGVQDAGEVGVPNITVTLYDGTGTAIAITVTDENGYYIFPNLPAGTYSVGFSNLPTGYSFTSTGQGTSSTDSDCDPTTGLTPSFTIIAGEQKTDVDAGLISVRAMIGNFVWEDLDRDGVQDAGEPGVSGVTVTLYDNSNNPIAHAITNAQGEYYFVNISPSTYTLGFTTIPANMQFTTQNATTDLIDSDVAPNGLTASFTVAAGEVNLSFDAGLITPPKGGLTGYVWYDRDKDGIQDVGELPVPGVTVILYASDGVTVIATTVTDGNGLYVFDNLPLGDYIIGFSTFPNGYVLTNPNVGGNDAIDSDADLITFQSGTYTVVEGIRTEAADAGLIKPTANIGDFVWKDNDHDGIQDAGEPGVSGVTVTLYDATGTVIAVTKTDAYGHYLFRDIPAGNYEIGFSLPIDYVFSPTTGGNESTDSDADAITGRTGLFTVVAGTDTLGIDAGIYFQDNPIAGLGNYVWLDSNGNGIQDATERGVSNVTVTLYNSVGTSIQTTLTDQNGFYQFQNLTPADYSLGFTLPIGYIFTSQDATSDASDSDVNTTSGRTILTTLSVGEQDMTWDAGIVIQAPEKASVGDFVWNDLDQNGIQEAGEPGVGGIQVNLKDETGGVVATTYTDAYGFYIFTNVDAGAYYIQFSPPITYTLSPSNQGTDDEKDSDINLIGETAIFIVSPGDRLTDLDAGIYLTSPAGTAALGDYVWFDSNSNGIQDATEAGVGGITVTLLNAGQTPIATTVTDENGYYIFVNLAQTTYFVKFSNLPDGYKFTTKDISANTLDATDSDVNVGNGQTDAINLNVSLNVTIDAGLILQAREGGKGSIGNYVWYDTDRDGVQDATESGVADVTVILTNITTGTTTTMTTDGTGYYLFNNLDEGLYSVHFALLAGYTYTTANIGSDDTDSDADPSGNSQVIILGQGETNLSIDAGIYEPALNNPASLGNYVWLDENKNGQQDLGELGVPGVSVTLYDGTMTAIRATTTDVNGLYMFTGLTAGVYTVGFSNLPSGYIFTTKDKVTDTQDSDADRTTGLSNAVVLSTGQTFLDVDAGIYSNIKAALGNYVWYDTDNDGIQNNSPQGVNAVTVILYDGLNTELASTVTDANGYYYFPNLDANTYTVGFSSLPIGARFTLQDIGPDDTDSDANTSGMTAATPLAAGEVNLTLDAGIGSSLPASLFGYVWYDYQNAILPTNSDGIQTNGETGVPGVTVSLLDGSNNLVATAITGSDGNYLFDHLTAGTYSIQFSTIPNGTKWTTPNQGGDDKIDSDAIPTGPTTANGGSYTVAAGEHKEAADAGLIPPASLGGIAFSDGKANNTNTADGVRNYQDPNDSNSGADAGIGGVFVILLDENKNFLRVMRTGEDGRYMFRGLESGKKYWVAFESFPSGCATCDFTSYNNAPSNDSTDSDVDPNRTTTYNSKTFMLADSVDALLPFEHRPNIDAGYRLPGSVFPIELLSLTAQWKGQDGLVKWTTSTEQNSAFFGIERSLDGGKSFTWLGNVVAAGNSLTPNSYSYTDISIANQVQDVVYYRLKLMDLDATYQYSEKVELNLNTQGDDIYFNPYPNPTQDMLYIDYHVSQSTNIEFRLINTLGQVLYTNLQQNEDEPGILLIDMKNYSTGTYILQLNTNNKSYTRKIVKE